MCAQQVSRWLILTGHGVNRHDHFNVNYLKAELHQTGSTPLTSSQINSLQNIRRVSLSSDLEMSTNASQSYEVFGNIRPLKLKVIYKS